MGFTNHRSPHTEATVYGSAQASTLNCLDSHVRVVEISLAGIRLKRVGPSHANVQPNVGLQRICGQQILEESAWPDISSAT